MKKRSRIPITLTELIVLYGVVVTIWILTLRIYRNSL